MASTDSITLNYIDWFPDYRFRSQVNLGSDGKYYLLDADYSTREDAWYVSLFTEDEDPLIQGQKLVIGYDVLELCYHPAKPDCKLIPNTDEDSLLRVDYENMVDGSIRLYHLTNEDVLTIEQITA